MSCVILIHFRVGRDCLGPVEQDVANRWLEEHGYKYDNRPGIWINNKDDRAQICHLLDLATYQLRQPNYQPAD